LQKTFSVGKCDYDCVFKVFFTHKCIKIIYFFIFKKLFLTSAHQNDLKAMFVSQKVVSGKPLSKLSYVCLPLGKLVNEKHFSVKEKFDLVFRKVFSWKIWAENTFRKL